MIIDRSYPEIMPDEEKLQEIELKWSCEDLALI